MDPQVSSIPLPPPMPVAHPSRIGVGPRLGAALLDFAIIIAGGILVGAFLGKYIGSAITQASPSSSLGIFITFGWIGWIAGMVAIGMINSLLEALSGASLGKIIVGLKIGSDSGVHASSGQLWGRWAIKNCYTVFLVIGTLLHLPAAQSVAHIVGLVVFIGFFFIFGENRQGFHDMIAHTAVYRRSELV